MIKSRDLVKKFMMDRGWEDQLPGHVAKSIVIEASELLELFQWSNPTAVEVKNDRKLLLQIKSELADVFVYCLQMSLILGLDVDKIVEMKLKYAGRKYPADVMKLRSPGGSLATKEYLKIKKAYRARSKN